MKRKIRLLYLLPLLLLLPGPAKLQAQCSSNPTVVSGSNPTIPFGTTPATAIDCELRITSGNFLWLNNTDLFFTSTGSIVVESGALLHLEDCQLLPATPNTVWEGIIVQGSGNVQFDLTLQNQGFARLIDTRIENAEIAVASGNGALVNDGGVFLLDGCEIINPERYGVYLDESTVDFPSPCRIEDCFFSYNRDDWSSFQAMVYTQGSANFPMVRTFMINDMSPSTVAEGVSGHERGIGYHAVTSTFLVNRVQFEKFAKGMDVENPPLDIPGRVPSRILRSRATDCYYGMNIRSQDTLLMALDTVELTPQFMVETFAPTTSVVSRGAVISYCDSLHMESCFYQARENSTDNNFLTEHTLLSVYHTPDSWYRNNFFSTLPRDFERIPNFPRFHHMDIWFTQTKTRVECNTYQTLQTSDVRQRVFYVDDTGPIEFGASSQASGNTILPFSPISPNIEHAEIWFAALTTYDATASSGINPALVTLGTSASYTKTLTASPTDCTPFTTHFAFGASPKTIASPDISSLSAPVLFPNPTVGGKAKISWPGQEAPCEIRLYSVDGRLQMQREWQPQSGDCQLKVQGLPAGMYLVKIQPKNGSKGEILRWVVQ